MRVVLLLLIAGTIIGAELEHITLADGRKLIGYYDEQAGTLTIENPKATLRVERGQVVARSPYVRPIDSDPLKRDEAELVRLEAEAAAARAEAERLRRFASTRSGKDAEVATVQAAERESQAKGLEEKAAALQARIQAAKPAKPKTETPARKTGDTNPPEVSAALKAISDAQALRDQAVVQEFDALVVLLKTMKFDPVPVPELGPDPRQSEVEQRDRAKQENQRRLQLSGRLQKAAKLNTLEDKETWSRDTLRLLEMPTESQARRDERESAERRNEEERAGRKAVRR